MSEDNEALEKQETTAKRGRKPGRFAGQATISDSAFDPMTEEELRLIEEGHDDDPLRESMRIE